MDDPKCDEIVNLVKKTIESKQAFVFMREGDAGQTVKTDIQSAYELLKFVRDLLLAEQDKTGTIRERICVAHILRTIIEWSNDVHDSKITFQRNENRYDWKS